MERFSAYAARWVAKSLVAAKLAQRCHVSLDYSSGFAEPTAISVNSFGSGAKEDKVLVEIVRQKFDLRIGSVFVDLDLTKQDYVTSTCFGHFGRGSEFSWERPKTL